jgi:hypothetical protein
MIDMKDTALIAIAGFVGGFAIGVLIALWTMVETLP